MHIPDGFLDARVWTGLAAVSTGAVGYAAARANREIEPKRAPLMGMAGAFVFAAQMINFPVAPGISGHLVGAVLLAVLLGPNVALVVMTAVLAVQCLVFQDGGLTALGANVFNMGVLGAYAGYGIYWVLRRAARGSVGWYLAISVGAWCSVVVSAGATATELALSGALNSDLRVVAPKLIYPLLLAPHALIGAGEALLSVAALRVVSVARPDLIPGQKRPAKPRVGWVWGLVAALVIGAAVSPFASRFPDGLEWAAERLGIAQAASAEAPPAPLPDYSVPGVDSERASTGLAGAIGTAAVFLVAAGLVSLIAVKRRRRRHAEPTE